MANIQPFRAIRYAGETDLSLVTAPPYDVISPEQRVALENRHPDNVIYLTLGPRLPTETDDRYGQAGDRFRSWLNEGVLVTDDEPSLFLYRFDPEGEPSSAGIIAALELESLGEGDVLPHERTMPAPKADRLALMRTTQANLEPLWFVASRPLGFVSKAMDALATTPPLADVAGTENVRHRLWRLPNESAEIARQGLRETKLVIADGHHRYETSISYRDERRASDGHGPWDFTLAMIQDPIEFGPILRPIHRLVSDYSIDELTRRPSTTQFSGTLEELAAHIASAGPGLVGVASKQGLWTIPAAGDLDTLWLDQLLKGSEAKITYEHDLDHLATSVSSRKELAFVLAPVDVQTVTQMAVTGERMPPKTTLFWPKPLSGLVMRDLADPRGDLR